MNRPGRLIHHKIDHVEARRHLDSRMRRFFDGNKICWNQDDAHSVRELLGRLGELERRAKISAPKPERKD